MAFSPKVRPVRVTAEQWTLHFLLSTVEQTAWSLSVNTDIKVFVRQDSTQCSSVLPNPCFSDNTVCLEVFRLLPCSLKQRSNPKKIMVYGTHRVGRMLSFFLQSLALGLPQPLTHRRVCPPPFGSKGRGTLAGERGGG